MALAILLSTVCQNICGVVCAGRPTEEDTLRIVSRGSKAKDGALSSCRQRLANRHQAASGKCSLPEVMSPMSHPDSRGGVCVGVVTQEGCSSTISQARLRATATLACSLPLLTEPIKMGPKAGMCWMSESQGHCKQHGTCAGCNVHHQWPPKAIKLAKAGATACWWAFQGQIGHYSMHHMQNPKTHLQKKGKTSGFTADKHGPKGSVSTRNAQRTTFRGISSSTHVAKCS